MTASKLVRPRVVLTTPCGEYVSELLSDTIGQASLEKGGWGEEKDAAQTPGTRGSLPFGLFQ